MSVEFEWDGWWEGAACYSCDCCGKTEKTRFESEEESREYAKRREQLKKQGWIFTKVNGKYRDFCGEQCRNKYIRNNTI